jgi:outer membrane receptor protein involved in Fe transport
VWASLEGSLCIRRLGWKGADGEKKYLDTRGYYYLRDELFTGIDETAIDFGSSFVPAVNLLNARVTWLYDDHLRVTRYVNNLLDEEYFASGWQRSARTADTSAAVFDEGTSLRGERRLGLLINNTLVYVGRAVRCGTSV